MVFCGCRRVPRPGILKDTGNKQMPGDRAQFSRYTKLKPKKAMNFTHRLFANLGTRAFLPLAAAAVRIALVLASLSALGQQTGTFRPGQGRTEVWVDNRKVFQYPDEFRQYGTNVYNIKFVREYWCPQPKTLPVPLPKGHIRITWRKIVEDFGGGSIIEGERETVMRTPYGYWYKTGMPHAPLLLLLNCEADKVVFLERERDAKSLGRYTGDRIYSFGLPAGFTNWNSNRIPIYDVGKLLPEAEGRRRMAENAWAAREQSEKARQDERAAVEARTVEFLKTRARDGSAEASYDLGKRYLSGQGVKKDIEEAKRHFNRAAEQGHQAARTELERLERAE